VTVLSVVPDIIWLVLLALWSGNKPRGVEEEASSGWYSAQLSVMALWDLFIFLFPVGGCASCIPSTCF
jgi:hypothetical protein